MDRVIAFCEKRYGENFSEVLHLSGHSGVSAAYGLHCKL